MGRRRGTARGTAGPAAAAAMAAAMLAAGTVAGCGSGGKERAGSAGAPTTAGSSGTVAAECPSVKAPGDSRSRQLRGMWIATVSNVDWPTDTGQSVERQKADYRRLLDRAKALNLNAVFVQIRPTADAFYRSPYEPWSQWLTGKQGKDPGYDVLDFLLKEAHARDMEFHAWFNPYRVSMKPDRKKLAPNSPARKNPSWVVKYGDFLWYDPGLPQVRDLATNAVLDVVRKYDIDAVHFDDYFYPYPTGGRFGDQASYKKYGHGMSLQAWRRQNVDTLVQTLSQRIHQTKPWVRFGIAPFGVWRNKRTDPAGSQTKALESYDEINADTRKWIRQGWLDYVTPQLYWTIGDPAADYKTLVGWWSQQVAGTKVQLTIGQAAYRVGEDKAWSRPDELSRHLTVNAAHPEVRGDVYFSAVDLMRDKRGFASRLRKDHYSVPAIPPEVAGRGGGVPGPATGAAASTAGRQVRLRWHGSNATSYAVYRVDGKGAACAPVNPANLLVTVRGTAIGDPTVKPGHTYTYYVTALDRLHHESAPGHAATIAIPGG